MKFYQLMMATIHGLYKERYAYRENMTDVIIQHLITEEKGMRLIFASFTRVWMNCYQLIKQVLCCNNTYQVQKVGLICLFTFNPTTYFYRETFQGNKLKWRDP